MQPIDFESPLKKIETGNTPKPTVKRAKLFADEPEPPKLRTLTELYGFNLDKPPLIDKDRQFFAVRSLVEDIENVLEMRADYKTAALWRSRVSRELDVEDFDKKMAELGAILFYISKDEYNIERFAVTPSLMEYRAEELKQEVTRYLAAGSEAPIPSGKIHYLMRAFAHMVLTKDHVYNRGGLIAIRQLLTNPHYKLAHYLQPEHRQHILTIIQQLLSKPGTANLFNTRFTIHESLKDLIRVDLKLDSQSPIDSTLVLYDCLMALFADVRQFEYPNCYAIAAFIYCSENHTGKILYTMLDWLKTGYYTVNNQISIPIRPLLEARLACCRDFSVPVNPDRLITFAPIEHIQSTLRLKAPKKRNSTPLPLDQALRSLMPASTKEQWNYAAKLYNGFLSNALVTMNSALLEFENSNLEGSCEVKEPLICACIIAVKKSVKKTASDPQIEKLGQLLDALLWVQPCYEKKVVKDDGTIQIGSTEVIPSAGNDRSLVGLLHESMRLFVLEDDQFKPIRSISTLRAVVASAMKSVAIPGGLNADIFADEIAEVCQEQIRPNFDVTAANLKERDLLVFCQKGGYGDIVLSHVYKISAQKVQIRDAATAYALLEKLFVLFKTSTLQTRQEAPKLLIHSNNHSSNHEWTVNAKCWEVFSTSTRFYPFIQESIFVRAKRRLDSQISQDVFISIVLRYTDNQKMIDKLMASYKSLDKPTYRNALDLLRIGTLLSDEEKIRAIVDEEFSKVSVNKKQLSDVLRALNIKVSTPTYERIYYALKYSKTLPFLLARDIGLALIENKAAVKDPLDIEIAICKVAQLPLPISIGDTNWTDDRTEDPSHTTLWSRYSYWDNTLGYYIRTKTSERRELNWRYRNIVIHHPVK